MPSKSSRLSRSVVWVAVEALGGSALSSVGLIAIASIIGPSELGLGAIVLGLMQTVNFFPDTFFHDAIIQRRRLSASHLGSAFWSVCMLSVLLGALVAASSAQVAQYYGRPELAALLLVLAASALPTAAASIQTARLRRAMHFRTLAIYAVISRGSATATGLALALSGAGAWAVVAQYGLGVSILAALLAAGTRWRFIRNFSFAAARDIGAFALMRTLSHFVDVSRGPIFFTLLGHFLPLAALGHLNMAFRLVESTTSMISSTLLRLYLPILSRIQRDRPSMTATVGRACHLSGAVLVPLFAVLAFTSKDLVSGFAGPQWQELQNLLPWFCVVGIVGVVTIPSNTAMLAVGRPTLVSVTSVSVMVGLVAGIFVVAPTTSLQAAMCWTFPVLGGLAINLVVSRFAIGFQLRDQISSRLAALVISSGAVAAAAVARRMAEGQTAPVRAIEELAAAGIVYLLSVGTVLAVSGALPFRARTRRLAGPARVSR